jgi:recombination protein RecT
VPEERSLTVTERIEREEFSRGHIRAGEDPVAPRPAATLVLARAARPQFEVLLLRRPDSTRFAAGAYVFAGGGIDAADADPGLRARLPASPEPAALAAAIRELFEETGLLLAERRPPSRVLEEGRRQLLAGELDFATFAARHDIDFTAQRIAYIARWVTPELLTRRYDARFFLAAHPGGELRLTAELAGFDWQSPSEAIERFAAGGLPMLFPTRVTLERLRRFRSLGEALEAHADVEVEPILPRLLVRENGVIPVLPDDPRYHELS